MKKYWPVLVAAVVLAAAGAALVRRSAERDAISIRRAIPASRIATDSAPPSDRSAAPTAPVHRSSGRPERLATGGLRVYTFSAGVSVAGCPVQLVHETTGERLEAVTEAAGVAEIPTLRAGGWHVGVDHGSYVPTGREVEVVEGRTADVSLELALGGRVIGRVVDASNLPIPGAEVFLLDQERELDLGPAFRTAADETGAFQIDGVPITTFGIGATAEHFRTKVQMGLRLVSPSDAISVEIRLEPGTFVSGRVVDDLDRPVPNAFLTAGNEFVRAAQTDEQGRFTITGLGDERLHMSAAAKEHGTVFVHDVAPNTEGLVIRLPRGGVVEGRVVGGAIPEGTAVLISRWDDYWKKEQVIATQALTTGAFRIGHLAPGAYQVWIEGPGVTSAKIPVDVRPDAVTGGLELRVAPK